MKRLCTFIITIALLFPGYSHAVLLTYEFDIAFDTGGGTGSCPDFICDNLPNSPASGIFTFDTDFIDQNEREHRGHFQGASEAYVIIDDVRIEFDRISIYTNLLYNDMHIHLDRDFEIVNFDTGYITDMDLNFLIGDVLNNADVLPGMREDSAFLSARTNIEGSFGSHQGRWRGNTNLVTAPPITVPEPSTLLLALPMLLLLWKRRVTYKCKLVKAELPLYERNRA